MEVYKNLREELNELGYTETLKVECVPLTQRLLADLKVTTENLQKYLKISQQAVEELDNLKLGAEPYKCDNAKLIRECNELHLAFIQFREQHERTHKDLKLKNSALEEQLKESSVEKENLKKTIKDLEARLAVKKVDKKQSKASSEREYKLSTSMAYADQKIASLSKEIKRLKDEQLRCMESNEFYKMQLKNRDEEIARLNGLLSGGRPTKAISDECCFKNIDNKIGALQDEINTLKSENNSLHAQLKGALAKQHEAMKRALHLAERNKQLENEMRDIDKIALAVESECNDKVRNNAERVTRLQDRLNESIITIQNLEREISRLKNEKVEFVSELSAIKVEKKKLESLLNSEVEDKKRLTDRMNNFTIIERDLNLEIDRLVRLTADQKRKLSELEYEVISGRVQRTSTDFHTQEGVTHLHTSPKKKNVGVTKVETKSKKVGSVKKQDHKKVCKKLPTNLNDRHSQTDLTVKDPKCCCEAGSCVRNMRELLEKEMEFRQVQLQREHEELLKAINEKNSIISELQREIHQDKYSGRRTDSLEKRQSDIKTDEICNNITCKRKSRELEILREELKYLEKENSNLKDKIQSLNESKTFDQERIKKAFQEMEEHITKLENERRDLVVEQCSSRSSMNQLQEEHAVLREQLRAAQNELNSLKATNVQLKNLQDQSAKALTDTQNQLLRAQTELHDFQSRMQFSQRESSAYETEIARLKGDVEVLKSQLTKMDKEKDDLLNIVDEKTEKVFQLETQLQEKKNAMNALEQELKDLKRKLSKASDELLSQEMMSRSSKQEIAVLEKDLGNEVKLKESAIQENRRLQNELASIVCDCKEARKELEIKKRQVEDLKTQLQHYVAEVKRAEDLISQKELERSEILDQFKCLSEEANLLESNNHTLESEANQSKVQLSVALDHASDLERKVEDQECIIKSYERQITELTNQIASLEVQMRQSSSQQTDVIGELQQMKDLCLKLDHEKDELRRQLCNRDEQKGMVNRDVERLTRENQELRRALDKEENNQDGLEKLLAEARQEVIEQRLLNEEMKSEISKLRKRIEELQSKLYSLPRPKPSQSQTKPSNNENKRSSTGKISSTLTSVSRQTKVNSFQGCYQFCNKKKCVCYRKKEESKIEIVSDENKVTNPFWVVKNGSKSNSNEETTLDKGKSSIEVLQTVIQPISSTRDNGDQTITERNKASKFCITLNLSTYSGSTSSSSRKSKSDEFLQVCTDETIRKSEENPWRVEVKELNMKKNAVIKIKKTIAEK